MHPMKLGLAVAAAAAFLTVWAAVAADTPDALGRAKAFIATHETRVRPLEVAANLAWWRANTSGNDADYKAKEEAQNKLDEILADQKAFAELKALRAAADRGDIADKLV